MKIKTLSISIVVTVICLILLLQFLTYENFTRWGNKQIDIMFDNTVANIESKINDEISLIEDIAFHISVDESVQKMVYNSTRSEIVRTVHEVQQKIEIYNLNVNSTRYASVFIGNNTVCSLPLNDASSNGLLLFSEDILKDARNKMKNDNFIEIYSYGDKIYFAYISKIFPMDTTTSFKPDAFVLILFELRDNLFNVEKAQGDEQPTVTLMDKEQYVLLSNAYDAVVGEKYVIPSDRAIVSKRVSLDKISCEIGVSMKNSALLNIVQPTSIMIVLIVVFSIAIFVFLMFTLNNKILKSILEIQRGALRISRGDYNYRLRVTGENEMSDIAVAMNGILDSVEEYNQERIKTMNKLYEAEILQKQAEISHMQNQISPHFLYNSLELINNLAQKKKVGELVAVTNIMAATFRYYTDGSEFTTIGEDINYAFNYFNVINLRREKPIEVIYNVQEEILDWTILKMIFQPILENIIKHAFPNGQEGKLIINGAVCENYAIISFEDNGQGILEQDLQVIKKRLMTTGKVDGITKEGSIGILNVHNRLRLFYDDPKCGVSIDSTYGVGTIVSVKMKNNNG